MWMIDTSEFRRVMSHYTSGVAVVTSVRPDGAPCGLTINSLTSVSLEPTLVLVCIGRDTESHDCIREAGRYAVNILEQGRGETLARRFATYGQPDKFRGVAYRDEATGAPILDDALAWLDCRIQDAHPAGDHTIFVAEVVAADAHEGTPLVYYRGGYGRFLP